MTMSVGSWLITFYNQSADKAIKRQKKNHIGHLQQNSKIIIKINYGETVLSILEELNFTSTVPKLIWCFSVHNILQVDLCNEYN